MSSIRPDATKTSNTPKVKSIPTASTRNLTPSVQIDNSNESGAHAKSELRSKLATAVEVRKTMAGVGLATDMIDHEISEMKLELIQDHPLGDQLDSANGALARARKRKLNMETKVHELRTQLEGALTSIADEEKNISDLETTIDTLVSQISESSGAKAPTPQLDAQGNSMQLQGMGMANRLCNAVKIVEDFSSSGQQVDPAQMIAELREVATSLLAAVTPVVETVDKSLDPSSPDMEDDSTPCLVPTLESMAQSTFAKTDAEAAGARVRLREKTFQETPMDSKVPRIAPSLG